MAATATYSLTERESITSCKVYCLILCESAYTDGQISREQRDRRSVEWGSLPFPSLHPDSLRQSDCTRQEARGVGYGTAIGGTPKTNLHYFLSSQLISFLHCAVSRAKPWHIFQCTQVRFGYSTICVSTQNQIVRLPRCNAFFLSKRKSCCRWHKLHNLFIASLFRLPFIYMCKGECVVMCNGLSPGAVQLY